MNLLFGGPIARLFTPGVVLRLLFITGCLIFSLPISAQQDTVSIDDLKKLSIEELMNIEVTSVSRRAEKLSATASAIQVVSNEDIRRSGSTLIPEALRLAGNLQVAQKNSNNWGISARGFNTELSNKLLVLMDGRAVYSPLYSGVFWNRQDYLLEDINRVEVISGPGGTLWGSNAVNGVINITSKSAEQTQGLYVEGGGGTTLQASAGARYGGKIGDKIYYRVYGKYFDRDEEIRTDGSPAHDGWNMGQGGFRMDMAPNDNNSLTLQGDLYSNAIDVSLGKSKQKGANMLARWTHQFSEESSMKLQVYYDKTHWLGPTTPLIVNGIEFAPAGTFIDDLDTYDLDFQHNVKVGKWNHIVWGLQYRFKHNVVSNAPTLGFFPTTQDQNLYGAFVQDEISISNSVALTLGSKLERNDYTGFVAEPNARIKFTIDERQGLWAAVSRAVRIPSRVDRDLSQGPPPYIVILKGGPDFKSETVLAYELGYRAQLGNKWAGSASTFFNNYDHLRSTDTTFTTVLPLYFKNDLTAKSAGLELAVEYRPLDKWRMNVGYNFLYEQVKLREGKNDFSNRLNETADPKHQIMARTAIDLPFRLEFNAIFRWVDALPTNNSGNLVMLPAYSELDLRLGWNISDNFELSLAGRNLLHKHHPEYGVPSPSLTEIERGFYGKLVCRF